ncbi:unnamed protein product [Peniophora sp. CBMAI 1063]|nr:unnamed protein product [Peniophora sp. CBMAI 1063]
MTTLPHTSVASSSATVPRPFSAVATNSPTSNISTPAASARSEPQSWIIALIVLAVAALLASIGACIYVYLSRWRTPKRASLSQDVIERYRDDGATNSSLAMLPGTPRSPIFSTLDSPSVYTTSSALGSWTNLPLLTPTLTPGFDAHSQQASVHDAAYYQSSVCIVPPSDDQSLRVSRSTSLGTTVSSESHTSASKPTTAKTFVTGATAGSRPPPVPPLSEIPLPPVPVLPNVSRPQSAPGHARANTQTSSKTFDTAATTGSVGIVRTPSVSTLAGPRPELEHRAPLPTPVVQGHARADTQTSSHTFATAATQGSHPATPSRRQSMPSGLVPHDPFASTRPAPLAVAGFPHWPPTPSVYNWPSPPQSPPPPPPPPVPPIPQRSRELARVSGKSTASTARSPPSYRTVAGGP